MSRFFLISGAINGFLSVALGAFAAHALKSSLSEYSLSVFATANQYHMFHSLVLVALGFAQVQSINRACFNLSGHAMLLGIILFSGSLYALALSGYGFLGMIAPLGGFAFLTGWAALFVYALRIKAN